MPSLNIKNMTDLLQSIGFSEKEANVYITLLKLGTQPASVIGRHVNMPRSTANFYLEELAKQGYVNRAKKANTHLYTAEDPSVIIDILQYKKNQQIAEMNGKIYSIESGLGELQSLKKGSDTRPKVTFYDGEDGLVRVYEDTLTSSEKIRSFASFDGMHGALPEYFKSYYERRAEKNIFIQSIHPDSPLARERGKNDKLEARESVIIPSDKYNFTPEIQFYDNKINIASWREKLGIIIESKEIYDTFVVMFDLAWQEGKKIDVRKKSFR
ncbi:hypothetical protein COB57_00105 [Candidatus Peregrinibacteria bacterium]|nr:MAG: hypothetical protein COB57_00105 [Candidatus Peregrinibacteria bacterium]